MISPDAVLARAPGIETADLSGEKVVLDPAGRKLRGLNATGAKVWELLDGTRTVREIAEAVSKAANIDAARALTDVSAFLDQLLERQLVTNQAP